MRVDIVIPAYNEEHRLGPTLTAYRAGLPDKDVRFLVVLDCCTDGTADIVKQHSKEDPRIELHEFPKLGKGGVLLEGFNMADAEVIGFVDADCATPPTEMKKLLDAAKVSDGAIASRYLPESVLPVPRSALRAGLARTSHLIIEALFRLGYKDTQCGAKVIRRDAVQNILPLVTSSDFMFDVDLLVNAKNLGYSIAEIPTTWIDKSGSKMKQLDALRCLVSAFKLWRYQRTNEFKTSLALQQDKISRSKHQVISLRSVGDRDSAELANSTHP